MDVPLRQKETKPRKTREIKKQKIIKFERHAELGVLLRSEKDCHLAVQRQWEIFLFFVKLFFYIWRTIRTPATFCDFENVFGPKSTFILNLTQIGFRSSAHSKVATIFRPEKNPKLATQSWSNKKLTDQVKISMRRAGKLLTKNCPRIQKLPSTYDKMHLTYGKNNHLSTSFFLAKHLPALKTKTNIKVSGSNRDKVTHQQQKPSKKGIETEQNVTTKMLHSQNEQIQIRIYPQNFTWVPFGCLFCWKFCSVHI